MSFNEISGGHGTDAGEWMEISSGEPDESDIYEIDFVSGDGESRRIGIKVMGFTESAVIKSPASAVASVAPDHTIAPRTGGGKIVYRDPLNGHFYSKSTPHSVKRDRTRDGARAAIAKLEATGKLDLIADALVDFADDSPVHPGLAADHEKVLREIGAYVEPAQAALDRISIAKLNLAADQLVLDGALTEKQAAVRLGVTQGRVRQRKQDHSLIFVKDGKDTVYPAWQFTEDGELPGWRDVCRAIPADADAYSILSFLTTPSTELEDGEGDPVAPRDWLLARRSVGPVVSLAAQVFDVR